MELLGAHSGAKPGRGGWCGVRGQPGTTCSCAQSQPGNRHVPGVCVWDPLVWLWDTPKLSPRVCSPRGVGAAGLWCGLYSWSPQTAPGPPIMLLGGRSGSWALKWSLDELLHPGNVPLWSSIHREGELPPVATLVGVMGSPQGLEQQLCLVLWLGNSREFSGSHRMAQGATATTSGDIHSMALPIPEPQAGSMGALPSWCHGLGPSSLGKG